MINPFTGYPVATDEHVDPLLKTNMPVAMGISGGKDSTAMAWATTNHLNLMGHTGPRLLIHSDLGKIEWADSIRICQQISDILGVELVTVRRPSGGMVERWMSRWDANVQRWLDLSCVKLILPWSTPSMRFCTSELKTAIICRELNRRYKGMDILSASGIRRQESSGRAKKPVSQESKRMKREFNVGLDWNPIIEWSLDQVWDTHRSYNLPIHEAYSTYESSRVSCMFCIMSSLDDLIKSSLCPGNQDTYRELVDLENTSTFGFQDRHWLGDIAPHLLTLNQQINHQVAKKAGAERQRLEAQIPTHLLYEKGWPNVMPTYSEAALLGQIRSQVARVMHLTPTFIDPTEIMHRYAQLMSQKK
ncbi:MAG: hypothetical protein EOO39_00165 [Cytophagaceae bacterium]|nr:MAG: hypothetical protein EOO39_00165 [Cytophagaceae bacterium]